MFNATNDKNTNAEVRNVIGTIVKDGIRFSAEGKQPVLNVRLSFRRSWNAQRDNNLPAEWKEKKSYISFAFWGDRAAALNEQLADIDQSINVVKMSVDFSLADLEANIWGTSMDRAELKCRATSMTIYAVGERGGSHAESTETFVAAPEAETEEVL